MEAYRWRALGVSRFDAFSAAGGSLRGESPETRGGWEGPDKTTGREYVVSQRSRLVRPCMSGSAVPLLSTIA